MKDYEVHLRFMARWTKEERVRFQALQSLHYPKECDFVDMVRFFQVREPTDLRSDIGPVAYVAAKMLNEDEEYGPNFYEELDAHGSMRNSEGILVGDEVSGEIDA